MWGDIAIAFLLAFITSFVLTPYTIKIAKKIGAVDVPKDERRMHKKTMPKPEFRHCFLYDCLFTCQHSTCTRLTMMAETTPMTTPAITPLRIRKGR